MNYAGRHTYMSQHITNRLPQSKLYMVYAMVTSPLQLSSLVSWRYLSIIVSKVIELQIKFDLLEEVMFKVPQSNV